MKRKSLTAPDLKEAILDSLTPDLLERKYREQLEEDSPRETGHCAVATEAFYYLSGGRDAGFMPVVRGYYVDERGQMIFDTAQRQGEDLRRETHWWTKGPSQEGERGKGEIFDMTAGQFPDPFPYEKGHNTGFMQPQQKPSRRAQIVIDRVTGKLGAKVLGEYKKNCIKQYKKKKVEPLKKINSSKQQKHSM